VTARSNWISRLGPRARDTFGRPDNPCVAVAPGRVNLIGEHTDYNDGWVLPMAIDRMVGVAAFPRNEGMLRAHSVVFGETREFRLENLAPTGRAEWIDYVAGTAWALISAGHSLAGADILVDGDVPLGSGLSSSAAMEMATSRALCAISGIEWDPVAMALLGQKTEWEFIGVKGGVMDQFTATMARGGHAMLLDCRTLETRQVSVPDGVVVMVLDTGASRSLAGSAYNERSASCRKAVAALQTLNPEIKALRDVDLDLLEGAQDMLDGTVYRRARHVVGEIPRPLLMAEALAHSDLEEAGRLMNESHDSLRVLYEVSSFELDLFTDLARRHPGCYGARLTGAGFGGCAVALVKVDHAEDFMNSVHAVYREQTDLTSAVFAVRAASGARLLESAKS
jgi:galactokinase